MKHFTELTVADRAALLTAMRQSLDLHLDDGGSVATFCEAVSFADDLPATLMLAEAIDSKVSLFEAHIFTIDPTALIEVHGGALVSLALRMACVDRVENGARTMWKIGNAGPNDPILKLESDLLKNWAEHYQ